MTCPWRKRVTASVLGGSALALFGIVCILTIAPIDWYAEVSAIIAVLGFASVCTCMFIEGAKVPNE